MPGQRISVLIPAYNAGRYLAEAIESVLAQALPASEIIVVDDGSTDDTVSVAAGYYPRVRCVSQPNGGIGAARNAGVAAATGDLFAFLDADDLWLPEKLRLQSAVLDTQPETDLVFGHAVQFISPDSEAGRHRLDSTEPMPGYVAGAMLARREAYLRTGPFATGLKVGEFIDWYARAKDLAIASVLLPEVVLRRRLHDTNTGIRERDHLVDYARMLRATLARRRASGDEVS